MTVEVSGEAAPAGNYCGRGEAAWMLVLDRKLHEGFWIDDRIFVKVLAIGRHRVKLGIEAPSELPVLREELREQREGDEVESRNGEQPSTQRSLRTARGRN